MKRFLSIVLLLFSVPALAQEAQPSANPFGWKSVTYADGSSYWMSARPSSSVLVLSRPGDTVPALCPSCEQRAARGETLVCSGDT